MRNNIILLYNDGTTEIKDERKITKDDIKHSQFLLVRVSSIEDSASKNFILVNPSQYLLFNKAVIQYQIEINIEGYKKSSKEKDSKCNDLLSNDLIPLEPDHHSHKLKPIQVETESITDVCNLLTCINRLMILNGILSNNDAAMDICVNVSYFRVVLSNSKDKIIYDEFIDNALKLFPSNISNMTKNMLSFNNMIVQDSSYEIRKQFEDLIDPEILSHACGKYIMHDSYLFLSHKNTWYITDSVKKKGLIGAPLKMSGTILFLTLNELKNYMKYDSYMIGYHVCKCPSEKWHQKITELIENGEYERMKLYINDESYDKFNNVIAKSISKNDPTFFSSKFITLDILSNIDFIANMSNILFSDLEYCSYEDDMIETLIGINFIRDNNARSIYFNSETVLSLKDILNNI